MCKPHWNAYTNGLRKAALARKAAEGETLVEPAPTEVPKPSRSRAKRANKAIVREGGAQGDAG
ncbi:MAG TPA: hypothetical protein VGK17_19595 [Propionicimonas sp.]|jgi:hypothetical protein